MQRLGIVQHTCRILTALICGSRIGIVWHKCSICRVALQECDVPCCHQCRDNKLAEGEALCTVQMVRFSQSFDEDDAAEDDMRRLSSKPPLAPSGGSVSLAAQHFCPVCGIIATSQDNLEVPLCCLCSHTPC